MVRIRFPPAESQQRTGADPAWGDADGDWLALPQTVVRIVDDDAQAIDQVGAQIPRLHRFRREFGCGGDITDGAVEVLALLSVVTSTAIPGEMRPRSDSST